MFDKVFVEEVLRLTRLSSKIRMKGPMTPTKYVYIKGQNHTIDRVERVEILKRKPYKSINFRLSEHPSSVLCILPITLIDIGQNHVYQRSGDDYE